MIYGRFKYITNSNEEFIGVNSILDSLPVKNVNFFSDSLFGYVMIEGDITSCDLSMFDFTEISQEEAFNLYKTSYPNSILLEDGSFGHTDRLAQDTDENEVPLQDKMIDPAKWGLTY